MTVGAVFDGIYAANGWNGTESRSGPGSGQAATARLRVALPVLVSSLGASVVVDVGCGDGYWMPDLPGYVGCDVSAEAVALAQRRHPDRAYVVGGLRDVQLEPGLRSVLVFSRDAMQHLPLDEVLEVIVAAHDVGARWLLASTYIGGVNRQIAAGDYFEPDLMAAPFLLGRPDRIIPDGYGYHDPDEVRDPRKYLALWRLR